MRELMGDQAPPLVRPRRETPRIEHDVVAHCVGMRIHVARRLPGGRVRMHPHAGKILPEARLQKASRCRIERLPRRAQHLMHDGWRLAGGGSAVPASFF